MKHLKSGVPDVALHPVNKTAALVIGDGPKLKPSNCIGEGVLMWEIPPQVQPIPMVTRRNPGFRDLSGQRHGRIVIVGYLAKSKGCTGTKWLARCDCGMYVVRTANAWNKNRVDEDMCQNCRHVRYLREKLPKELHRRYAGTNFKD